MPENIQKEEHLAIENIFGNPPGWILNWGITLGFIFLILCFSLAYFIKYPDTLSMQGELIVGQKPIVIVPKVNGVIDSIYKFDKDIILNDDVILTIQTTLDEKDIKKFYRFSSTFENENQISKYLNITLDKNINLGELTPLYTSLTQSFFEFQNFLRDASVFVKLKTLEEEIQQIIKLNKSLYKQGEFYNDDIALTEKDFNRNLNLEKEGVITAVERERVESKLLNEKSNLEAFNANIIRNKLKIKQLESQIAELKLDRKNGVNTRIFTITQQIQDLKSRIVEWEDKYKIKAPITGQLAFNQSISPNDFIRASEPLLTIIPEINKNQISLIEGLLPIKSSGTLKVGQKAIIQIDNYPSNQYGTIKGVVHDISLLPNEENYRVKVELPLGLKTTYNKEIPMLHQLKATVSINTQDFNLLERIFQNILDITKNKNQ